MVAQDGGDDIAAQAVRLDVAVAIHRPEDWAVIAGSGLAPRGKSSNRAVAGATKEDDDFAPLVHLVGLASPQVPDRPFADVFDI